MCFIFERQIANCLRVCTEVKYKKISFCPSGYKQTESAFLFAWMFFNVQAEIQGISFLKQGSVSSFISLPLLLHFLNDQSSPKSTTYYFFLLIYPPPPECFSVFFLFRYLRSIHQSVLFIQDEVYEQRKLLLNYSSSGFFLYFGCIQHARYTVTKLRTFGIA